MASPYTREEVLLHEMLAEMKVSNYYSRCQYVRDSARKLRSDALVEVIAAVEKDVAAIRDWQTDQPVNVA